EAAHVVAGRGGDPLVSRVDRLEVEHPLAAPRPGPIDTVGEIPELAPADLAGGSPPEPEQTRVALVAMTRRHDLADRVLAGVIEMVQVEEVEPVPLLPGPRGVPKVEQDAFEIGTDEASRGPLGGELLGDRQLEVHLRPVVMEADRVQVPPPPPPALDRKSTRLNSSHVSISYAVFCLKKKKKKINKINMKHQG